MNPLTNVKNIQKLNQRELDLGNFGKKSWHDQYKDSAWIFTGGLPYDLTEGDILAVFSQYGEIVNINLVRDKQTGKSKGYGFICYEDQRSTVLSVDNLNGIKLLGRTIRVDHVEAYKKPKEYGDEDDITKNIRAEGCAPKIEEEEEELEIAVKKIKKEKDLDKKAKKKKKKEKKKKKKKEWKESSDSSSEEESETSSKLSSRDRSHDSDPPIRVKTEKKDPGYDKAIYGRRKLENEREEKARERNSWNYREVNGEKNFEREYVNTNRYADRNRSREYERYTKTYEESSRDRDRNKRGVDRSRDRKYDDRYRERNDRMRDDRRDRETDYDRSRDRRNRDYYDRNRHRLSADPHVALGKVQHSLGYSMTNTSLIHG